MFLLGWKKLGSLGNPQKFKSWLCTIARNHATRSTQRWRRDAAGRAVKNNSLDIVQQNDFSKTSAKTEEREDLVRETLADLPDTYRETMILFYREQQSVTRVAQSLDLTEAAVRQRLVRGRAMLRDRVESVIESVLEKTAPPRSFSIAVLAAIAKPVATSTTVATTATTATTGTGIVGAAKAYLSKGLSFLFSPQLLLLPLFWYSFNFEVKDARSQRERTMVIWGLVSFALALIVSSVAILYSGHPRIALVVFMAILFVGSLFWKRKRLALRAAEKIATPLQPLFDAN